MLTDDFLSAGTPIAERIKARCGEIPHVMNAADLDGVLESKQPTPAAHVIYDRYRVVETQAEGERARLQQTWVVVLVERNVAQHDQASQQRAAIGPLAIAALRALQGWAPSAEHSRLIPTSAPYQTAYNNGFIYVPLAFTTEVKIAGDKT